MLSRDRAAGARAIEASGTASIIIMDDGFQNPSLVKDLALIAVDAGAGLGNGRVFPAGPLRTALRRQMKRASAAILIGDHGEQRCGLDETLPVIAAKLSPAEDAGWLRDAPVLAFSGIGRPGKFFASLEQCGARLIETRAFPDHHTYTAADALDLLEAAERGKARLVTTEKDMVRLGGWSGPVAALAAEARTLPVKLDLRQENRERLLGLLRPILPRAKT
jgi:tetraacyldisaccharide 4'-kinase